MRYDIKQLGSNKLDIDLDGTFSVVLTDPWSGVEKTATLTSDNAVVDFYGVPYQQENLAGGQIYFSEGTWKAVFYNSSKPIQNENQLLTILLQVTNEEIMIASGEILSADVLQLGTTPYELVPAPGAGKVLLIKSAIYEFVAGGAVYSNDTINTKIGTLSLDTTAFIGGGNQTVYPVLDIGFSGLPGASLANTALTLSTASDPTTGTGTLKFYVEYDIVNLNNL